MKCILIHPQASILMLLKNIIIKTVPAIELFAYNSTSDIQPSDFENANVILLLGPGQTKDDLFFKNKHATSAKIILDSDLFPKEISDTLYASAGYNITELSLSIARFFEQLNMLPTKEAPQNPYSILAKENNPPRKVGLILIGVSTGGPEIMQTILQNLAPNCPPILIAQHLPKGFSSQFSEYLSIASKNEILETEHRTELQRGRIVIAKSGFDVEVIKQNSKLYAACKTIIQESSFHPSVDRLFTSASILEETVASIILTGMGKDGMLGAKHLHTANNKYIIAQDPSTCTVDGMPKSVIEAGLSNIVMTPQKIIEQINNWSRFYE